MRTTFTNTIVEDGTILYSDEPRLIGERFELGDDERAIFTSNEQGAEVSDLSEAGEPVRAADAKLLEVYLPIETPSGTAAAVRGVLPATAASTRRRAPALGRSSRPSPSARWSLLELVQIPLAWSMARRLRRVNENASGCSGTPSTPRMPNDAGSPATCTTASSRTSPACRSRSPRRRRSEPSAAAGARCARRPSATSIKSLRSLLVEIYPPNLQEEGCSRPSATCSSGSRRGASRPALEVDLGEAVVDPETAGLIYRAAQESSAQRRQPLRRHAVRVDLRVVAIEPRSSVSCVSTTTAVASRPRRSTNEPPTGTSVSVALAGLVADLGGALTVRSAPGEGTRVEVSIPIDARLPR